jgi:hypothetical protein
VKPVYQTIFLAHGNCWRAAIASILELDIDDMPCFESMGHRFLTETRTWLNTNGYSLFRYGPENPPASYAIAVGESPRRKEVDHAIVVKDGVFVHDPFPTDFPAFAPLMALKNIKEYWAICRFDDAG